MLTSLVAILSTSYVAWYLQQHELAAVYPFDATYATPADAGAPKLVETAFDTKDGARLIVWRAAASAGRPTIVYFPGNSGALKDRADRFQRFVDAGFGLVAPAYRGSSGSTGTPEELLLVADAVAIAQDVAGTTVLYGESLGAAVAIRLAADGIGDAVVLEAPFTSLVDLVAAQFPMEDLGDSLTQRWDSLASVGSVDQPLLVIHGEADQVVPFAMGQSIFDAAGSPDKLFVSVQGHGHSALWTSLVEGELFGFLGRDFRD